MTTRPSDFLDRTVGLFRSVWQRASRRDGSGADDELVAIDPDLAYSLTAPHSFDISIKPIRPIREATVQETLSIDRSRLRWEADMQLECREFGRASCRERV